MNCSFATPEKTTDPRFRTSQKRFAFDHDKTVPSRVHQVPVVSQTAGNLAIQRSLRPGVIQLKLIVSAPGDVHEGEADRVADQVLRMPTSPSAVTGQVSVQRQTLEEEEVAQTGTAAASITSLSQRAPEEEDAIQTKALVQRAPSDALGSFEPGDGFEAQLSTSGGSPLPVNTRAFMEPRFRADFTGVRLHTGDEAVQLTRAISAQAFTHGQDIYFGEGTNNLESSTGKQLLAHELTHVVQQSGADVVRARESTGNRGLSVQKRIIGSNPFLRVAPTVQRSTREELLTAYNEALSRSDWNEVAVRLNGFNDVDIKSLVGKYSKATLIAVKDAALTVMPGWNARVVRPANARLAALMGSDQVLHASAKEIQDYLLHSPFLKAYVSSKFSGGNPLEGHIHIDDDAAFRTACIAYTMRQGKTREEAEVIEPQQSAFREGDDIHVRKDDGKFTTTIHESMHRFSSPAYQRGLSNNANEGAAEYFTRIICKDQTLTFKASYPNQLNSTDLLVGASSKEMVADAFFSGAVPALLTAVDTAKGAGTLRRWSEFMNTGSYKQADALLK